MLETFELKKFFAGVVAGDTLSTRKPSPEPLLEAVARAGGAGGKAAMVGDSIGGDILAGDGGAAA